MTEEKKQQTSEDVKKSIYSTLSKIDVSHLIDKKMGLNYLSWAKAWGLVKSIYPDADKEITEYPEYLPTSNGWVATGRTVDYRLTIAGCEVEASVIIKDQKFSSQLYVMDNHNKTVMKPNYSQINKTQMRALVKALAFAGLGLNVYAGEDLPSEKDETPTKISKAQRLKEKIANAQRFEVQYGGGKEKLVDVVSWEKSGDKQAHMFIETWTKRDPKNLAAYEFIEANGLYTVKREKKEA
ncbi:Sak single strand annealing protein [Lactobacillus crispatus]|uniref:DUF1071 domain-containing protein n=1 Tax=Lactobacillus crispatus TaxID=47770 RepID=A0A6A1Z784_9LACO|nr:DUF1071 domain-containing protein [Lactobacillus crispatus]KAB1977242.1 DUF1071 domain-containing protein [Lactobacillus crispatus]MCT3538090.1 DUF1071 domain-containing protein [Lactobacillus crispatus]